MADLTLPAGTEITSMPMGLEFPGLEALEDPHTGKTEYLSRSPGRWVGTAAIAVTDNAATGTGAELNMLCAALRGGQRTLDLPLQGPTLSAAATAAINNHLADEEMELTDELPGASIGDFIQVTAAVTNQVRVHQIRTVRVVANVSIIRIEPYRRYLTASTIARATTIEVRQRTTAPIIGPRDPDFWGPWLIPWKEVVP